MVSFTLFLGVCAITTLLNLGAAALVNVYVDIGVLVTSLATLGVVVLVGNAVVSFLCPIL